MGSLKGLRCPRCGWEAVSRTAFRCASCDAVLEVLLELGHLTRSRLLELRNSRDQSLWRWFDFFPVESRSSVVTLGEGYTPLLRARGLAELAGLHRLYLKNDTLLPTGSLKDRSNAVGISRAVELGFKTVAVASTGNAASSVAAYAAAAGLDSVVLMPGGTHRAKVLQAQAYGGSVVLVDAEFDRIWAFYAQAVAEFGWYDCLSTNPYRNEGKKSYAYELFDQLDEHVPDWIIHPTAGGTGLVALWKGYEELCSLGWAHRTPKLVAAQSEAAAPIVRAFRAKEDTVEPVTAGETVAESIRVGNPSALGWRALRALWKSNGTAIAIPDNDLLEAQRLLGRLGGIFAEPSGAASVAAALRLRADGVIRPDEMVVCNITGHGLKQPETLRAYDDPQPIPPDLEALRQVLTNSASRLTNS